jgi:DNA-binding XRE family transcriptional regulator
MARKFAEIEKEILADPAQRAEVEKEKAAMRAAIKLAELRDRMDTTQSELAAVMGVTQANVSRIERQENVYLSTLSEYVEALGGKLEISAVFNDRVIPLA